MKNKNISLKKLLQIKTFIVACIVLFLAIVFVIVSCLTYEKWAWFSNLCIGLATGFFSSFIICLISNIRIKERTSIEKMYEEIKTIRYAAITFIFDKNKNTSVQEYVIQYNKLIDTIGECRIGTINRHIKDDNLTFVHQILIKGSITEEEAVQMGYMNNSDVFRRNILNLISCLNKPLSELQFKIQMLKEGFGHFF